ncbi:MAG: PEGA domain-containing protein [Myxococcota bacterium]|nr:PEGA domain-containing protein [Myxococcota bacterium]
MSAHGRLLDGLGLVLALGLAAGCGGSQVSAGGVTRDDAILSIRSNVRDAQVYVDGRFVTPLDAAGGGIAVEPGLHRFELRHEDYFSSYLELTLGRAERKKVSMELAPILP